MFLEKIILKNFKSFYKTSVIELPEKITAIVGPNGSGKSNIVDAIRWALGEQSFKNLRAEKGSNLIFWGKDKSAGFAEVELIFDNSKKVFPLEYSEVSILRRITKEDINSYYINHQPCRLKDITELMLNAKLGVRGLSIINQGSVENILKVSPYERRLMLEENLGLKNLEIKREYSKKKLENTILNLEKVKVQVKEILPHLRFLQKQVKHWEEKQENENKLKNLQKEYFALCYLLLLQTEKPPSSDEVVNLKQQLHIIEKDIKEIKVELGLTEDNVKKQLEQQIATLTQEIISLQKQKFSLLEKTKFNQKQDYNFNFREIKEKLIWLQEELKKLLSEDNLLKIKEGIHNLLLKINTLISFPKDAKEVAKEINLSSELKEIEQKIAEKEQKLTLLQAELEKRTDAFQKKFSFLERKQEEKEQILQQLHYIELEQEKYNLRFQDLERRIKQSNLNWAEIEEIAKKNTAREDILTLKEKLERSIARLERVTSEIGTIDESTLREYQDVKNRYEFLSQQVKDLTTAIQDLKHLISELTHQIEIKFQEALEEINQYFNRYFRLMFQGGSARLIVYKEKTVSQDAFKNDLEKNDEETQELLTEEIPPENSWGVKIKVDIPKTKLKTLEALSGGEKSLTAIALLFAIVNQSNPLLVIVDEIDAALDEENSRRFAEILKELSKDTQFIIVTHNRLVMEAANIIYGVTLQENISRLFSLKLEDNKITKKESADASKYDFLSAS